MKMLKFTGMLAVLVGLFVTPAAGSIVYTVDRTVGTGTIVGSITTNGDIGTLDLSDITAWTFTLGGTLPSATFSSGGFSSLNSSGSPLALEATATELKYDFSELTITTFNGPLGIGPPFWELNGFVNEELIGVDFSPGSFTSASQTGLTVIATAATETSGPGPSVPEPASLAIFGLGLVGLGLMRRRKAD